MPSDLPKNILKLMVALFKHQAELWLGEETVGLASKTLIEIGGDKFQQGIDRFLETKEVAEKLQAAARRAEEYFQSRCQDAHIQGALSFSFGDLPPVQEALGRLPRAMDAEEVRKALAEALRRDVPALSPAQVETAAGQYTEALQRALLPLKDFTLPIIGQVVLDNQRRLIELGVGQAEIKALIEQLAQAGPGPRGWMRPPVPRPGRPMIGRSAEFEAVAKMLQPGRKAAITAALQGTPGVGKTVLAEHLAAELDGKFPGGVIFERLGVGFRDPLLANPILEKWYGFSGRPREANAPPDPDEVRAYLSGRGNLLVVLDDAWDVKAIQPLLIALPNEACLLVTTRSRRVAQELRAEIYTLNVLSDADALDLLKSRAQPGDEEIPLLKRLAVALGNHAQALDIAAGSLARLAHRRWLFAVGEMERQVREGSGFGELHLPGDEAAESRVEAALSFSYHDLQAEARGRFRLLGAFAPDGGFSAEAAAGVWNCTHEEAEGQLSVLAEIGLLMPVEQRGQESLWIQHTLLRAYALALLKKEGEEAVARSRQANTYNERMREAAYRQVYYRMLAEYPQLGHAFAWASEHDLDLAVRLAGNTANLQASFYLVGENYAWAKSLADKTQSGDPGKRAAAIINLANALARLANLPGEERRARLLAALAAYDEALQHYRPDTAPLAFAMTQANLALLFLDLSTFPDEDRKEQFLKAIQSTTTALLIFSQVGHEPYAQHTAQQLRRISEQAGPEFAGFWQELGLGEMPDWLK